MNFEYASEFQKELKKLQKKWRSLPGDIADAELGIAALYAEDPDATENRAAFFNGKRAIILQALNDGREVIKMRLDVESLGTNAKVRIVFIAIKDNGIIRFIELYAKNDKPREDTARIQRYLNI